MSVREAFNRDFQCAMSAVMMKDLLTGGFSNQCVGSECPSVGIDEPYERRLRSRPLHHVSTLASDRVSSFELENFLGCCRLLPKRLSYRRRHVQIQRHR